MKYSLSLLSFFLPYIRAGVPSSPLYFDEQLVSHTSGSSAHWTQRYYASGTFFSGPGSPIFLILGGESAIEPSTGFAYPFIVNHLARDFSAYVVQPEHRFYGESQPLTDLDFSPETSNLTTTLMTSEQAMWDAVRLVQHIRRKLGCHSHRSDRNYCPVITVGGSYPGFLSAMMRVRHPDVVDMAYAASAPMKFYSQAVNQFDYYDRITSIAEKSSPGCADAVVAVLVNDMGSIFRDIQTDDDLLKVASLLGICPDTVPSYIIGNGGDKFYEELSMVVAYTFANYNMAYYPPDENSSLYRACQTFQDKDQTSVNRLAHFLRDIDGENSNCFNMTSQLPLGSGGTISAGDWSGVGVRRNGQMWDFQTCTLLVEHIGFGPDSMFPSRPWTMDWMRKHCHERFGVVPYPFKLVEEWQFDDLLSAGVTHIVFTNGLNDGWSVGGIQQNMSDTLLAINFENGAHHSDLSGIGPSDADTPDIRLGFKQIRMILRNWLEEIQRNQSNGEEGEPSQFVRRNQLLRISETNTSSE